MTLKEAIAVIRAAECAAWLQAAERLMAAGASSRKIDYALRRAGEAEAQARRYRKAKQLKTKAMRDAEAYAATRLANPQITPGPQGFTSAQARIFASMRNPFAPWDLSHLAPAELKVGEIQGWRCWRICGSHLLSAYMNFRWRPGVTRVDAYDLEHGYGIHAWKHEADAVAYAHSVRGVPMPWERLEPIALGRVALWGEVIEHERGYRASHAKVLSLEAILHAGQLLEREAIGPAEALAELRAIYIDGGNEA